MVHRNLEIMISNQIQILLGWTILYVVPKKTLKSLCSESTHRDEKEIIFLSH